MSTACFAQETVETPLDAGPSALTDRSALDLLARPSSPSVASVAQRSVRERRGQHASDTSATGATAEVTSTTERTFESPEPVMMLYREGDFILDLTGQVIHDDETNRTWLAFERQTNSGSIVPVELNLLPCRQLELIQSDRSSDEDAAAYMVSGQVFVYRDANHLLITRARPVNDWTLEDARDGNEANDASVEDVESLEPEGSDALAAEAAPSAPDSATGVLQRLLNDRQRPPTRPNPQNESPLPSPAPSPGIGLNGELPPAPDRYVPESPDPAGQAAESNRRNGSFVVQRRARLTPGSDLDPAVLRFDADGGQYDPPVNVLPCRLLEQMEQMTENALGGDPLIFEVTGQIHIYRGQAYLLPRVVRRARS